MSRDDTSTRELAETKAYLERRITQLQEELSRIVSIVKLVDTALAEKSFKQVQIPVTASPTAPTRDSVARADEEVIPVTAEDGTHLGDMQILGEDLILTPSPDIQFDVNSAPFRTFLIGRILDPMSAKDDQASETETGMIEKRLSYEVEKEDTYLKRLTVHNYGNDRRLQELRNAIRWTLRTIHEKKSAS